MEEKERRVPVQPMVLSRKAPRVRYLEPNAETNENTKRRSNARKHIFASSLKFHSAAAKITQTKGPSNRTAWDTLWNRQAMHDAIKAYLSLPETPTKQSPLARGGVSPEVFATKKKIPPTTFRRRIASPDPYETPKLGRPELILRDNKAMIADTTARCDELNKGRDVGPLFTVTSY